MDDKLRRLLTLEEMVELYEDNRSFFDALPDRATGWPEPPFSRRAMLGLYNQLSEEDAEIFRAVEAVAPLEDIELIVNANGDRWVKVIVQTFGNDIETALIHSDNGRASRYPPTKIANLPDCRTEPEDESVVGFAPPYWCRINDRWIVERRRG